MKFFLGGRVGGLGQGSCEQRSEVIAKIQKELFLFLGGGRGGGGEREVGLYL